MKFESDNNPNLNPILAELKRDEESYRLALEEARKHVEDGSATPSVIDDLETRYLLAKQERERQEGSV
jgi:hypothetical protein